MDESKLQKQTSMATKSSSIKRKPLADLTNIVRKSTNTSFFQSKKPASSAASDSSIGSTQNPINVPPRPIVVPADHLVGEENQTAQGRKHSACNTRSKTKAVAPFYQSSFQERRNNVKESSVSFCSSTLHKIMDKTSNDGRNSSTENIKDKRKAVDVPLTAHLMKNTNNSTDKDKGKENVVQSNYSLAGNANSNMGSTMPDSVMKGKDKGKAIAEPLDYPSRKKLKNFMMEFDVPLKGVIIKEREGMVTGSGSVNLAQKDKGKGVSTPINYHTLQKDQQISCPPVLRTMSNRDDADGIEDVLQYKLQTEPPPNKKKRRCSTKEDKEAYTLPKEFVEQQRAYFKEIDDFELQVEEV